MEENQNPDDLVQCYACHGNGEVGVWGWEYGAISERDEHVMQGTITCDTCGGSGNIKCIDLEAFKQQQQEQERQSEERDRKEREAELAKRMEKWKELRELARDLKKPNGFWDYCINVVIGVVLLMLAAGACWFCFCVIKIAIAIFKAL